MQKRNLFEARNAVSSVLLLILNIALEVLGHNTISSHKAISSHLKAEGIDHGCLLLQFS